MTFLKNACNYFCCVVIYIRATREVEPGQDWKVAALTFTSCVHFFYGSVCMDDDYYMKEALKEAQKAYQKNEVPVGSVIVLNGKIIARGHNLRESTGNILKHAELIAINKASKKINNWKLTDMVMYVTLFPCPMCASAIVQSRIKKVIIGAPTKDKKIKQIVNMLFEGNNTSPKVEVIENILMKECQDILSYFFSKKR